jgi:NAD(P)-dependent dehydrogenase (short-subunit alcohol dehydrogenase family)
MSNVVITGSTKGIGRGLAEQFIRRGHNVVVSSRRQADVEKAIAELGRIGPGKVCGQVCEVARKADVQALWDRCEKEHGRVDIWINNAGRAISRFDVAGTPDDLVEVMVDSNLKGAIYGSQVAMRGFRKQGAGALYNTLGGSFDGKRLTPSMGVYSSTKAGIWRLTRYLVDENENKHIIIGAINPGLLITENFFNEQKELTPEEWRKFRPLMNILGDYVETSTPWLVEQILANRQTGRRIAWMTTGKILGRFIAAGIFRRKRDLFSRFGL